MSEAAKRMLREFDARGLVGYSHGRRARVIDGLFRHGLVELVQEERRWGYRVGMYGLSPEGRAALARLYEAQDAAVMLPFYSERQLVELEGTTMFAIDWHGQPYWRPGTRQPKAPHRR